MVTASAAKPMASSQFLFLMVTLARISCRYFKASAAWNWKSRSVCPRRRTLRRVADGAAPFSEIIVAPLPWSG